MSDLFRDSSLAFFIVSWKGNFETSETASSNRRTEQRFVNMPSAVIYLIITWAETKILIDPHRDNELHHPSFDGFHAQLDCKVTNVLEKWGETRLRLVCLPTELRTSCLPLYNSLVLLPLFTCFATEQHGRIRRPVVFSYLLGGVGERYERDHMIIRGNRAGISHRQQITKENYKNWTSINC